MVFAENSSGLLFGTLLLFEAIAFFDHDRIARIDAAMRAVRSHVAFEDTACEAHLSLHLYGRQPIGDQFVFGGQAASC